MSDFFITVTDFFTDISGLDFYIVMSDIFLCKLSFFFVVKSEFFTDMSRFCVIRLLRYSIVIHRLIEIKNGDVY